MEGLLMLTIAPGKGFSLVEILVSLFVVSMTAVNITGLQQMVNGQNRDNFIHNAVLRLATAKMEEALQRDSLAELDNAQEMVTEEATNTELTLKWSIATPAALYSAGDNLRDVELQVAWNDSTEQQQIFSYREQVNLVGLLNQNGSSASQEAAIKESFIETNDVIYFEPKMGYKKGAFVIYNSELFEAIAVHSAGNGHPRDVDNPAVVADGWKSYGLIDNPALADNEDLATLFLD
jgi:Tfp pilus assembly protein PilV